MGKGFVIEDLRGTKNAPADFRVTCRLSKRKSYMLLFVLNEDNTELALKKCEIDKRNNKEPLITPIRIPESIEGYKVTTIKAFAFHGAYCQNGPIIPNTIRRFEANAFAGCRIHELYIPASVSEIKAPVFQNSAICSIKIDKENKYYDSRNDCNAIINTANNELVAGSVNTTIPDTVTKIGDMAFSMFLELKEITIPQSVTRIGIRAFSPNGYLEKADIASSIIAESAFSYCQDLKEVLFSDTVTIIEDEAFLGCSSLERIEISDSVTRIGEGAFCDCERLREVLIPNSVTVIEAKAFRGCSSLERIEIPDSVVSIGKAAFYGCDKVEISISNSSLLIGTKYDMASNYSGRLSWSLGNLDFLKELKESEDLGKGLEVLGGGAIDLKDIYLKLEGLKDSDALGCIIHETLKSIYWDLYNHLEPKVPHKINELFIKAIDDSFIFAYSEFVKYIRLFGMSSDKNDGNIDLYIDMNSGIVTIDKNGLAIDESIIYLDDNYEINPIELVEDVEIVEYSNGTESIVLNGDYQAVVNSNKQGHYEGSTYLKRICSLTHFDIEDFFRSHKKIFHCLSPYRGGDISNYFSLSSFCVDKYETGEYYLFACIGVDGSKASKECVRVFISEFKAFLDKISNLLLRSLHDYKRWQQAVEGAISKVMTRNSEHNHGSHVLAHLSNDNSYEKLCDEDIKRTFTSYISNNNVFHAGKNQQLPFFIRYLKNRGSYQSEAVFGVSNILTSKRLYSDVFKDLDQERILLNYISGVSDFSYKFRLLFNGNELHSNNDIAVAMPGDVIGCQAFYVIIENIIRNTAKHATKQLGQVITFTIAFRTYDGFEDDYIKEQEGIRKAAIAENDIEKAIDIWVELDRKRKEFYKDLSFYKQHNDYYCVEIDNGIKVDDIDELVRKQNELINDSILDRNFNLRNHSLGLIEMETSAAFLRQISISRIDSVEYKSEDGYYFGNSHDNLVILKAVNKNGALGYRFFMQKPKEFLLVGNFDVADSKKDAVDKEGVQFISEEDFAKAMSDGKSFAHPFLFYPDNVSDKTKALLSNDNDSKTLLPIRKVELAQDEIKEVVTIINDKGNIISQLKAFAWNKYLQSIGLESDDIYIGEVVGRRKFSNCRQVVFTNHGKNFETYLGNVKELPELWIDSLSSYRQGKLPLFASYSLVEDNTEEPLTRYVNTIPPQLKMEIFEAYHNKVVALDERIQRFSLESYEGSIPASTLFNATNVIIPKTKLDPEQFDELMIHELEIFINNEINGAFLLVHYGILERMYKTEKAISEHLEAWSKKAKRVVVTSGRGSHSLPLPASVCFANLSSVLNAFTENRCKFLINCLINQSRRKNE